MPWCAGCAILLWATPGLAQVEAVESATSLDKIVVTGTRGEAELGDVPRSVSVIDAQRIQRATQQLSLDEALGSVPGLFLQNRYNFAQDLRIALRGFGARANFGIRGIRLVVDGIPATLPDGQAGVDSLDLGSARQIEILRGPASSLYGNAAGGVIAVTSELGAAQPYSELRGAGGEFGYSQWQLKSVGDWAGADYLVNVSQTRLDGYREHSTARGSLLNARLGLPVGDAGQLRISLNLTDQPEAQDPGGINAEQAAERPRSAFARNLLYDAGEELEQQRLGAVYTHDTEAGKLSLRVHTVWRDFSNRLPFESGGAVDLQRWFYGGGAQFEFARLPDALRLSVGLDLDQQDDERERYDNLEGERGDRVFDQSEEVGSVGAYAHGRYALNPVWSLSAGLRYDEVSYDISDRFVEDGDDSGRLDFQAFSPSLAVSRSLEHGTLFLSYSSSFEAPSTTELANPDASGGFNSDLDPQRADNYELGVKLAQGAVGGELAVFAIDLTDELVPYELDEFPGRTFYANAGSSSRRGLEAAGFWRPAAGLELDLSYTWSEFEFDQFEDADGTDFSGRQLPGLPRHFGNLGLSYVGAGGLFARLDVNYAGRLYADNANAVEVDSRTVTSLRLAWQKRVGDATVQPYLGINNLFDETYFDNVRLNAFGGRYFEPAPGRSVYAGLSIRFDAAPTR